MNTKTMTPDLLCHSKTKTSILFFVIAEIIIITVSSSRSSLLHIHWDIHHDNEIIIVVLTLNFTILMLQFVIAMNCYLTTPRQGYISLFHYQGSNRGDTTKSSCLLVLWDLRETSELLTATIPQLGIRITLLKVLSHNCSPFKSELIYHVTTPMLISFPHKMQRYYWAFLRILSSKFKKRNLNCIV